MPELPDVEIIRRTVNSTSLHRTVKRVEVRDDTVLDTSPQTLKKHIRSHSFTEMERAGKYLFIAADNEKWLVMHFGMTGGLKYFDDSGRRPDHSRIVFHFHNDGHLAYTSRRKFGSLNVINEPSAFKENPDLGPDALEIDQGTFEELIHRKSGMIKPSLMDQKLIAGLGNVYVDELLYRSRIHPETKADNLNNKQVDDLYKNMKRILKTAVDKEADRKKMPDDYLINHRKEGEDCPVCSGKIKRIKVGGRSTYICPACQKTNNQ